MAASTTNSAMILCVTLVLIFLATAAPKANALIINGLPVNTLAVAGIARCSSGVIDNCATCASIPNLVVRIMLRGSQIASATTSPDGSFKVNINVGAVAATIGDVDNMRAFVAVPIVGCSIWAAVSTGHLEGTLALQPTTSIIGGVAPLLVFALSLVA